MATVKEIIEKAYTKVNGEYEAVVESSDDFKTYINVLNQIMEQWADTPYVKWQSLYDMNYKLPTKVASGLFIYAVADMDKLRLANTPYDSVYFVSDAGVTVKTYKLVDQAVFDASTNPNICSLVSDGLHLKSVSADIVGTSIRLPVYKLPDTYTTAAQVVKIDSNSWLVSSMAAFICDASPVPFIARNAEKFAKEAQVFMKTMRDDNRRRQVLSIERHNSPVGNTFAEILPYLTLKDL